MKKTIFTATLLFVMVLLPRTVFAQDPAPGPTLDPTKAWIAGRVLTINDLPLQGGTVCVKTKEGKSCVPTDLRGEWGLFDLPTGEAEWWVTCVPAEKDNSQGVYSIQLIAGHDIAQPYDLFHSTCFYASDIGPCPGYTFPPKPGALCLSASPTPSIKAMFHPAVLPHTGGGSGNGDGSPWLWGLIVLAVIYIAVAVWWMRTTD